MKKDLSDHKKMIIGKSNYIISIILFVMKIYIKI